MLRITSITQAKRIVSALAVVSLALLAVCVACYGQVEKSSAQAGTDDFYAYYTRLDYDIPVEDVMGYIQRVDEEDEEERWKGSDFYARFG